MGPQEFLAKEYAIKCHESTNHLYDGKPYKIHLETAINFAYVFIHLIPKEHQNDVLSAVWAHDVIEDCRETYNDVARALNPMVAEIVYAVTNEKGKTRKQRANLAYYAGIKSTPYATFVKLCDRLANVRYSLWAKSSMFEKYVEENTEFTNTLYCAEGSKYIDMFSALSALCKGNICRSILGVPLVTNADFALS